MTDAELICEVCGLEMAVGVAAVPFMPVSVAYGRECLTANAHPLGLLVANTAMIGGLDAAHEEWQRMVADTLAHLGASREDFDREVAGEMAEMDQAER